MYSLSILPLRGPGTQVKKSSGMSSVKDGFFSLYFWRLLGKLERKEKNKGMEGGREEGRKEEKEGRKEGRSNEKQYDPSSPCPRRENGHLCK